MKIYIELIIILVLMIIFIFWRMWFDISKKRMLKKYNPEENISKIQDGKGYKGGVFNNTEETRATEQGVEPTSSSSIGHEQPERRELLSETVVDDDGKNGSVAGENSSSTGKNASSIRRRFFRRQRKK